MARVPKAIWDICEVPPLAICTTRVAPSGTTPLVTTVSPSCEGGVACSLRSAGGIGAVVAGVLLAAAASLGIAVAGGVSTGVGGLGGATKVNAPLAVTLWVSVLVTTTSDAPAACAAVVQLIDEADATLTPVHALPPTVTVAPAWKPVPVIVIDVPPAVGPLSGLMAAVIVGGAPMGVTDVEGAEGAASHV